MSVAPVAHDAVPVHRRSLEYEAFEDDGNLTIVGKLRDSRPWARSPDVERVHDMELRVTVRMADLTITGAEAAMHTFPHTECPGIVEAFAGMVGLSVARGYTRAVQERFGGVSGCTHLEHLARSLGPVVIQATTSSMARSRSDGDWEPSSSDRASSPLAVRNTCHVWAEDGVAEQKLALGWQPGRDGYPAPALVHYVRRASGDR
ncbi:MAG TPA: DUF2889 domain-containing protein [Acidimicrobiales bacterium]|jgi:hypothetical protein|nr:DUF2889 domain-containing protein [Acidimicrobiales bacterium]